MPRSRLPAILSATIATLPDKPPFSAEAREAFRKMLDCAIDLAYGPAERAAWVIDGPTGHYATDRKASDAKFEPNPAPPRYTIDQDGFAMCDDKPLKFSEVPPGAVIKDLRTVDQGNPATILWDDCGARLDGALPSGASLRC